MYDQPGAAFKSKEGAGTDEVNKNHKTRRRKDEVYLFSLSLSIPGKFCIGSQEGKFPQFCKSCPPLQQHQGHKQSNSTEEEGNMLDIVTLIPAKVSPWWIPAH